MTVIQRFMPLLATLFLLCDSTPATARNIFLNGTNVSGAKNQFLENVTLQIDKDGNIYIEAPHYHVQEESTFIPLSQFSMKTSVPIKDKTGKKGNPLPVTTNQPASLEQIQNFEAKPGSKAKP